MLTKLQFKLAKRASDEARKEITRAQEEALFNGNDVAVVKCHRHHQLVEKMAQKLGFETEVHQVDFGYEIHIF